MHLNSQLLFVKYAVPYFRDGQRVLELGADGDPSTYRQPLAVTGLRWETADLSDQSVGDLNPAGTFAKVIGEQHVMPSEIEIPVEADRFDIVLAGQVIEHVRRPWAWLPELARVTKPSGHIILVSPISWPFHEAPVDCWRIYPDGMRALCADAGLDVEVCEMAALERPRSRRQYPDVSFWESSHRAWSQKQRAWYWIKRAAGWPMPTAIDLVTVATKPDQSSRDL